MSGISQLIDTPTNPRRFARFGLPPKLARLLANRAMTLGLTMVTITLATVALAPLLVPSDPLATNIQDALRAPNAQYPFGTDELGRDMLSRVLHGMRVSMLIGTFAVALGAIIGLSAGITAGYFGGWVDRVISTVVDIMLAFPGLLLAMVVVTILGTGLNSVIVAVGIAAIPQYVRVVRAVTHTLKNQDFIVGAQAVGCSHLRILSFHILPNILSPIIVLSTVGMAIAILIASSLSYLGLGAQPPTPELGAMLAKGRTYMHSAWWVTVVPGGALLFITVAVNMLGEGLRDALDPRLRVD